jgi:GH15 family glucan-1,4-alpha-glucosidase
MITAARTAWLGRCIDKRQRDVHSVRSARAADQTRARPEARLAFEKMLTYANHLGLHSEEIGPTGEQLGNFPQAFTHLALISAAYNLDHQLG